MPFVGSSAIWNRYSRIVFLLAAAATVRRRSYQL
jgi:hypothetical protein